MPLKVAKRVYLPSLLGSTALPRVATLDPTPLTLTLTYFWREHSPHRRGSRDCHCLSPGSPRRFLLIPQTSPHLTSAHLLEFVGLLHSFYDFKKKIPQFFCLGSLDRYQNHI